MTDLTLEERLAGKKTSVTLRIASKLITPDEITNKLKLSPTRTFSMGDKISSRSEGVRSENLWCFEITEEGILALENQLARVVEILEEKAQEIHELQQNCDVELFCGYFSDSGQAGFVLSTALLKRLSQTGVDLVFDVYT